MKNYRAFSVKYVPATNTRPSRIRIFDLRFDKKKIISYQCKSDMYGTAIDFFDGLSIPIIGTAEDTKGYIFFSDNFTTQIGKENEKI